MAAAEDLHRKYQAATSGENLLKLVVDNQLFYERGGEDEAVPQG